MKKKVFLVGVGGIGISALAKYFHKNDYKIFGSDKKENENILELKKNFNLSFYLEDDFDDFFDDFDFLVYSPSVKENNAIRKAAKKKRIKEFSYPEFLGKISKNKFTISICGTNGKTTSSMMAAELFSHFNKDVTSIIGGISKKFNSNFIHGESENFLVESCEFKNSFLNVFPDIIAITNITPDHLDFFGSFDNYKKSYLNFLDNFKKGWNNKILICDENDKNLREIVRKAKRLKVLIVDYKKYPIKNLSIPGKYNRENAMVALAICELFQINLKEAREYLENNFLGTKRRFDFVGKNKNGFKIYDDYAHNPEGISVLKKAFDEKFPNKKKVIIFEPHLFSRTQDFFDEFVKEISEYDEVFLLPIYKSRENPKDFKINSQILLEKIKEKNSKTFFCENFDDCQKKVKDRKYNEKFIIVTVGAGPIDELGRKLLK